DRALETAATISSSFFCTSTVCSPLSTAVLETDGTTVRPRPAGGTPTGGSAASGPGAGGVPARRQSVRRRSARAVRTSGGTRWETSPLQVATSLTREDDRKL